MSAEVEAVPDGCEGITPYLIAELPLRFRDDEEKKL